MLAGIAFGWLPGPGGIPLILAGLGLLSINHDWAKQLLHKLKEHSGKFMSLLFPEKKSVQIAYDILGVVVLGFGIWILTLQTRSLISSLAIALVFLSIALLLLNRKRIDALNAQVNKILRKR